MDGVRQSVCELFGIFQGWQGIIGRSSEPDVHLRSINPDFKLANGCKRSERAGVCPWRAVVRARAMDGLPINGTWQCIQAVLNIVPGHDSGPGLETSKVASIWGGKAGRPNLFHVPVVEGVSHDALSTGLGFNTET